MIDAITIGTGLEALGRQVKDEQIYEKYYQSKTIFENLDQQTKTILAQAEIEVRNESKNVEVSITQAEINRFALASTLYQDHIKALNLAREAMNAALAKVKSIEIRLEVYRSLNKHIEKQDNLNNF